VGGGGCVFFLFFFFFFFFCFFGFFFFARVVFFFALFFLPLLLLLLFPTLPAGRCRGKLRPGDLWAKGFRIGYRAETLPDAPEVLATFSVCAVARRNRCIAGESEGSAPKQRRICTSRRRSVFARVARPMVVLSTLRDRPPPSARCDQWGERAVHREPLQRVFFIADDVEVAPSASRLLTVRAPRSVYGRGEVRLGPGCS